MSVSTTGRVVAIAGLAVTIHAVVAAPGALQFFLAGFQLAVVLFTFFL